MFCFCVFGDVLGNYPELHLVPVVFIACFCVILQCFVMYSSNLFSVSLIVIFAVILTAFMSTPFCLLQGGTS